MRQIRWSSRSSCPAASTARPTRSLTFCARRSRGRRISHTPSMPHTRRLRRPGCPGPSSLGRPSISPLRARPNWVASGTWIWSTSRWWPAAPASANTTGSEVAYESFFLTAAPAASQRAGRDHFLRLLLCGRSRHAHLFPASVRLGADHLHQHPQRRQNGAEQPERHHLCGHLPLPAGDQLRGVPTHPLFQQ